jgi:hypothetical protein
VCAGHRVGAGHRGCVQGIECVHGMKTHSTLSMVMLEVRYSAMGASVSLMLQPAALRSAEASESSKACSHLRSSRPSISKIRPLKTFFLPAFSTVRSPLWRRRRGWSAR